VGLRGGGPAVALPFNRTRYEAFTKAYPRRVVQAEGDPLLRRGLARIIERDALKVGNARVPIRLRRKAFSGTVNRIAPKAHSLSWIRASLRSSAIPL
jgi:hypothetical protein